MFEFLELILFIEIEGLNNNTINNNNNNNNNNINKNLINSVKNNTMPSSNKSQLNNNLKIFPNSNNIVKPQPQMENMSSVCLSYNPNLLAAMPLNGQKQAMQQQQQVPHYPTIPLNQIQHAAAVQQHQQQQQHPQYIQYPTVYSPNNVSFIINDNKLEQFE